MRLLTGEGLRQIIQKQKGGEPDYRETFALDRLLSIFLDVCDAVTYAHSRGVLHLDIKPSNVRVGRYGQTILFDWGLAKVVGGDETQLDDDAEDFDSDVLNDMTLSGMMKGTPGYMAPEQTVAKGHSSPKTDIYSLGALLYFILTGLVPVKGDNVEEVVSNTREGKVINPMLRSPSMNVPGSLAAVAMKALKVDPGDRYISVMELREDITRYLRGFATKAERAGPMKRLQLYGRRHNKVLSAALLFSIALALVVGVSLVKVNAQRGRAVIAQEIAEEARLEAERNFELYRAEADISEKLYGDMKAFMLRSAASGDFWDIGLMEKLVQAEMDMEISEEYRKELLWMRGVIAFIRQEYIAAESYFEQSKLAYNSVLRKMARLGLEMKPEDTELLNDTQFAQLLELPVTRAKYRKQVLYTAYFEHKNRTRSPDPEEHLSVSIGMLNLINDTPGWGSEINLEPLEDGIHYHLDLSSSPYTMFSPPQYTGTGFVSMLKQLKLKSIDISNTGIRDFSELRRLQDLEILIARNVPIYDENESVNRITNLKLKRVVVSEGMFSARFLRKLRRSVEVDVVPLTNSEF
jgi:hypothetical protein